MEAVYQRIVQRDLEYLGIKDRFYPVSAAANYSLLYVIVRACIDFPINHVLELGAGQSTLLFDALHRVNAIRGSVCTLEHDVNWADRVAARVSHPIIRTSLVPKTIAGISFTGYDFAALGIRPFDLLLIDGPPAWPSANKFSRLGAADLVKSVDPSSFMIIVDDAEREGEMLLVEKIEEKLKAAAVQHVVGYVEATRRQAIIAGGEYAGAAYY